MSKRAPIDAQLQLTQQTVHFLNGQQGTARSKEIMPHGIAIVENF